MKRPKYYFITGIAVLLSILPAAIATLSYFPIWRAKGGAAILSGFTVLLLLLCTAPLIKLIKKILASPSILFVWLAVFLLFFLLREIADEMTVISFVGFISNATAAVLFKIAER